MSVLSTPKGEGGRIARFGLVGLFNTAVGYATILGGLAAGLNNVQANILGYAVGLAVSFVLNSKWTFRGKVDGDRFLNYLLVFAAAYTVNLCVLLSGLQLEIPAPLAHFAGLVAYTICFYFGSRSFVFSPSSPIDAKRMGLDWPPVLVAYLWAATAVLMTNVAVSHDIVWQLWIARQLLGGASLYRDIIEINPPLWFWMATPVQALADAFSVQAKPLMVAAVLGWSGITLVTVALLLSGTEARSQAAVLIAVLVATTIIPVPDFAQREHLALLAAIPYAFLISQRAEGQSVSFPLAACIGLLAAVGFALKHYFVTVPLLLEIWLLARHGRMWRPFRPETFALGLSAIVYVTAVLTLTPNYLSDIVPLVALAYHGYETSLLNQLSNYHLILWAVAAVALTRLRPLPTATIALILAAAGFCFSYFVQAKGWTYHAVPATGCLLVAVTVALQAKSGGAINRLWRAQPYAVAAIALPVVFAIVDGPYRNPNAATLLPELQLAKPGSPVLGLVTNPSRVWPMVDQGGFLWPSRHFTYWMLRAIAMDRADPASDDPRIVALAERIKRDTIEDMRCNPPEIIAVSIADTVPSFRAYGFDVLAFFKEDDELRRWLDNYQGARVGKEIVLHRKPDWTPPAPPTGCRIVH
jgi:putative flippase GtrA